MKRRYIELDSLRGIAAMVVLISHILFVFTTLEENIKLQVSYLSFLWNGHSAVILFFILSGFVLSLPFEKRSKFNYKNYLIKRYCRIYLPYIIVLSSALMIKIIIDSKIEPISNLQPWALWTTDASIGRLIEHLFFLGEFNADAFVMVIWSLVHELRISIIFPIAIFFLYKFSWKVSLGMTVLTSIGAFLLMKVFPTEQSLAISTNYFITFHYLSMFIIGALLAKNREFLIQKMRNIKLLFLILPLSFILYNYPTIPFAVLAKLFNNIDYLLYQIILDWIITTGASIIIIFALSSSLFSKLLLVKPIHYLGKISYSVYLVHPVVLISFVHLLYGSLPIPIILISAFLVSLGVATFYYNFIEVPSMNLGKWLTNKNHTSVKTDTIEKTI